jgi:hypothetical protein
MWLAAGAVEDASNAESSSAMEPSHVVTEIAQAEGIEAGPAVSSASSDGKCTGP